MSIKETFFSVFCFLAPMPIFASSYYYCALPGKAATYVNLGDSLEQVERVCGDPSDSSSFAVTQNQTVNRWVYDYQPNTALPNIMPLYNPSGLVVDHLNGKIIQILVSGSSVDQTDYCLSNSKTLLHVGDTIFYLRSLCGQPTHSGQYTKQVLAEKDPQIVNTYNHNGIVTELYFQNFKLIKIEP